MQINQIQNLPECLGNTPLIKLKIASQLSGCNIYGKCEFLNPCGSVKIGQPSNIKRCIDKIIEKTLLRVCR